MREELYEFYLKKDDAIGACSCEEMESVQMQCISPRSKPRKHVLVSVIPKHSTGSETREFHWCCCSSLNEVLIRNGYFPSQSSMYCFLLDFLEDHQMYNQQNGVPCYTTTSIVFSYAN